MHSIVSTIDASIKPPSLKASDVITDVGNTTPLPAELAPFHTRVVYFFTIWTLKFVVRIQLALFDFFNSKPENKPDLVQTYGCRSSLPVRIFIPSKKLDRIKSFRDSDSPLKREDSVLLPLYINVHGGGFAMADASIDDHFCRSWCERTSTIVVSLNYSKSPLSPFPVAVYDIAAITKSVIDDESLPIDKSRVIMGGFSAGGNLALTSTLLPELQNRIKCVVAYYPIVDWSHPPPVKWASRLCTEKKTESLARAASFLDWGYVSAGQDRKAKLLSPCYASRTELPPNICMVAAQHDMLCREARDMIYSLAAKKIPEEGWDRDFEEDRYKWMLIRGVKHGFTNDFGEANMRAKRRREICDDMYHSVHAWLQKQVLTTTVKDEA